jgi:malto-oligosyltrehalose trehalohydrolase
LGTEKFIPATRLADGWFELVIADLPSGTRYKFRINGELQVPDPGSRFQPQDVHGPSEVIDPCAFEWSDTEWRGRSWEEAVIYELHVGAFTLQGTFAGAEEKLDYLAGLGVTAIELMPVSDFPGKRNWGYDGVLPFAPDSSYGRPEDLKRLIQAAHQKQMMVLLDVVYNHFGPEGNYFREYSPDFFTSRHKTPWGQAINFDGPASRVVRQYFIHNALYWLEEYHFDGLRLDAVHAIRDDSEPDILTELAETVRQRFGASRHVHLVLENDDNAAHYLRRDERGLPRLYNAQWNDDIHHSFHVLITGETDGYYADYAQRPLSQLGRCLTEGFAFQGDVSEYRHGETRGESSRGLPPQCFVNFLQNHDQIGNRALGERLSVIVAPAALAAVTAILLLAPSPPLIFMGEEFGANTPFLFFCDFGPELARAVTEGRRGEFAHFAGFQSEEGRRQIPDPNAVATFERSKLDWNSRSSDQHASALQLFRTLLLLRQRHIVPLMKHLEPGCAESEVLNGGGLHVRWKLAEDERLHLFANLQPRPLAFGNVPSGSVIFDSHGRTDLKTLEKMPPWTVSWILKQ